MHPNEDEFLGVPDLGSLTALLWQHHDAIAVADLYFHGEPYSHRSCRTVGGEVAAHVDITAAAVARQVGAQAIRPVDVAEPANASVSGLARPT